MVQASVDSEPRVKVPGSKSKVDSIQRWGSYLRWWKKHSNLSFQTILRADPDSGIIA